MYCAGVSFGQPGDPRDPWVGTAELHLSYASVNVSGPSVARATSSGASVVFGDCSVSLLGGLTIASGVTCASKLLGNCVHLMHPCCVQYFTMGFPGNFGSSSTRVCILCPFRQHFAGVDS
jgi:hypothetical protein